MRRPPDPVSFGILKGAGKHNASELAPEFAELRVLILSFQNLGDLPVSVGWDGTIDLDSGEGLLHVLFNKGEEYSIQFNSGQRIIRVADFCAIIEGDGKVLVTARID